MTRLKRVLLLAKRKLGKLAPVAKWIGGLSAAIGLATAVAQGYAGINDRVTRHATVAEAVKVADQRLRDLEYDAAWQANGKALATDPSNAAALAQQTIIAMRWLEDARIGSMAGAKTFGDIADPLEDVLSHRATSARGPHLADIEAHIGWARFLKSRDGVANLRIREEFDAALAIDGGNMYAHVMRGFFAAWNGAPVAEIRADFDAALQSGADPDYCDRMILSALTNSSAEPYEFAAIEYANKIRRQQKPAGADLRERVLWAYEYGLGDTVYLQKLAAAMPPDEQIATLDWLMAGQNAARAGNDSVLRAYFLEAAGQTSQALAIYRQVAGTTPEVSSRAMGLARSGIHRLAR